PPTTLPPAPTNERLSFAVDQFTGSGQADHEVEAWAAEVAARHGFSDVSHTIEIFGNCADCRS
ncbi:hypothetical protein PJL70_12580, partial [Mycobacterium kansasii]